MVIIQEADIKDKNAIVGFQMLMALETEGLELDEKTVQEGVKYIFDNPARGQYWIAMHDDNLVASLLVLYEWSDWRNGDVIWVHSVYVKPEFRNKGIFTRMYKELKTFVEKNDKLRGIRLYVEKNNHIAQGVYKKLGMSADHYDMYEWMNN